MAELHKTVKQIAENAQAVDKALSGKLCILDKDISALTDAMAYSTVGGGKKIRASLTLEFCRLFGGDMNIALDYACAVEMIQSFSLVHDDLPCMDDDDIRRGKPSCHIKYGEAQALLAGDALVMLAFCTLASAKAETECNCEAVRVLSSASGAFGMCGGQSMDIEAEDKAVSFEYLEKLQSLKTGALICASAELGCIAAKASEEMKKDARTYAMCLGRAFQIVDDILDVEGDEVILGKPVGSDRESQKTTFVSALGLDKAKSEAKRLTEKAKSVISKYEGAETLLALAELMLSRKS